MNKNFKIYDADYGVVLENVNNFDLSQIFGCGQAFRFDKIPNTNKFCGVAFSKYVEFEENSSKIIIYGITLSEFNEIWSDFFDLNTDYDSIILNFKSDEHLFKAANYSKGIRILHQETFETLISFIISQNNNIPRIKKIIESMSEKYGTEIYKREEKRFFAFPNAEALYNAGIEGLTALKTGFRAKYIFDAAKQIYTNIISLNDVYEMDTETAVKYLTQIKGVGPKVAMCTLLFGFHKYDAFPIDVWMKKALSEHYGENSDITNFGEYAGVAQQYLFYYERCMSNVFA